jgi:hypothetical protein
VADRRPTPTSHLLAAYRAAETKVVPWRGWPPSTGRDQARPDPGDQLGRGAGAIQFLPSTWKRYGHGGDLQATGDAVLAAARLLRANQRAFLGYYHWPVFYGDTLLSEGYPAGPPRHPRADRPLAPSVWDTSRRARP